MKNNKIIKYFNNSIIVAMFAIASFANSEELNVAPEGFTALFNGKDFTGWDGYRLTDKDWQKHWKIEDGILSTYKSRKKGEKASIGTIKKDYKNFILLIDILYPVKQSDSGIFSRLGQINLMPSYRGPCSFEIWSKTHPVLYKKANDALNARKFGQTEFNKWYKIKIMMKGNFVTIEIDGELYFKDIELVPHRGATEGKIGLQKHGNKGKNKEIPMNMSFRNIFIKEID